MCSSASSSLIRPRSGPRVPSPKGEGFSTPASHVFALRSRDLHKNKGPGRRRGRRKGYVFYVFPGRIDRPAGEDPVQLHRQLRGNHDRCHPHPQAAAVPPEHPSAEVHGQDVRVPAADHRDPAEVQEQPPEAAGGADEAPAGARLQPHGRLHAHAADDAGPVRLPGRCVLPRTLHLRRQQ